MKLPSFDGVKRPYFFSYLKKKFFSVFKNSVFVWRLLIAFTVLLWVLGASALAPGTTSDFSRAAAVYWTGNAGTTDWNTAGNWNPSGVPTSADDVTVTSTVNITTSAAISFNTLSIGQLSAETTFATTTISHAITSGGSITIKNQGSLIQNTTTQLVITGTLTVQSGGIVKHGDNGTTHAYEIDFSAATLDVQAGGIVTADGLGFNGAATNTGNNGSGPGAGRGGNFGSGAGHGGNGGVSSDGAVGGTSYCDITGPVTLGSGGGDGFNGSVAGAGGGLIIFNVSGTATLAGTVTADGVAGTVDGGGGSGGAVNITADTIAGTPQSFTITGGSAGGNLGGGGGGCALLTYTTANSISATTSISMGAGTGYERGGAGVVYVKQTGTNGDLYSTNTGSAGAETQQNVSALTVNSLTLNTYAVYTVTSTKSLTLQNTSPFAGGDATGILRIKSPATLTPTSTGSLTIASSTLELHYGSTLTAASSTVLTLGYGGTLDQRYFTTSTASLAFTSLNIQNGGVLTHGANTTTQAHVINLRVSSLTADVGGSINVDGKGYSGGATGGSNNGNGIGPGIGNTDAGGGAHGGNGGAGAAGSGGAGGTAYCVSATPGTVGSGGGSSGFSGSSGGAGGGLVYIIATSTVTINGTVTADGSAGVVKGGGGAGGGVHMTADTFEGTPASFTVTGGAGGASGHPGGGGGGCVFLSHTAANSISSATVTKTGGSGNNTGVAGSAGSFVTNPTGPATLYSNNTTAQSGSANPVNLTDTTPAFSAIYHDADSGDIANKARIQVSTDSSFASVTHWDSGSSGTSITNCTQSNRCQDLVYGTFGAATTLSLALNDDVDENSQTTYYWRMKYWDDDAAEGSFSTSTATFTLLDAPNEPTTIATSSVSTASVGLTWVDNSAVEDNFEIALSTDGTNFTTTSSPAASATSATISTLSPNIQYTFRVRAVNTAGNSGYVTSTAFYTAAAVPTSVSASANSASAITVSWGANGNGPSTTYQLRNETTGAVVTGLSTTSYQLTGLSASTAYTFSVRAVNGDGQVSSYSSSASATTASSGGTGGSSPTPPEAPKPTPNNPQSVAFVINNAATKTKEQTVTISMLLNNVSEVAFSNENNFLKSTWQAVPATKKLSWKLSDGGGTKVVYAKFMSVQGGVTEVYRASIVYSEDVPPNAQLIVPKQGGTVVIEKVDTQSPIYKKMFVEGRGVYEDTRTTVTLYRRGKYKDKSGKIVDALVQLETKTLFPSPITDSQKKWTSSFANIEHTGEYRIILLVADTSGSELQKVSTDFNIISQTSGDKNALLIINNEKKLTNNPLLAVEAHVTKGKYFWISHNESLYSADALELFSGEWEGEYKLPTSDGVYLVYFKAFDENKQEVYRKVTEIILDTTPPKKPSIRVLVQSQNIVMRGYSEPLVSIIVQKEDSGVAGAMVHTSGARLRIAATTTQTTKADQNGNWNVTFSNVEGGQYQVSAFAIDEAGNQGAPTAVSLTVDDPDSEPQPKPKEEPNEEPEELPEDAPEEDVPAPEEETPEETPEPQPEEEEILEEEIPEEDPLEEELPDEELEETPEEEISESEEEAPEETLEEVIEEAPEEFTEELVSEVQEEAEEVLYTVVSEMAQEVADTIVGAVNALPEVVAAATRKAVVAVQQVVDNPTVEAVTEKAVTPVATVVAVVNVGVAVSSAQTLPAYLYFIFTQPAYLLGRRKRKQWGMAYNAFTKLPIDLVLIRLVDATTNRIVQTRVTDVSGRFAFFATPGTYRIEVQRTGFTFPTPHLRGKHEDGQYADLYQGNVLTVTEPTYLTPALALNPVEDMRTVGKMWKDHVKKIVQNMVAVSGTVVAFSSFIIKPSAIVGGALAAHIISFLLFRRLAHSKKLKQWGTVRDAIGKSALQRAVIRLFDAQYNKLLETQITLTDGRYAFLVGPNTYYVTYDKEGFARKKTDALTITEPSAIIARNEDLYKATAAPSLATLPIAVPEPLATPIAVSIPAVIPASVSLSVPLAHQEDTRPVSMPSVQQMRDQALYGGKDS